MAADPSAKDPTGRRAAARARAERATFRAAAALALLLLAVGLAIGRTTAPSGPQIAAGDGDVILVDAPAGWEALEEAPGIEGLELQAAAAAAPDGDPDLGLLAVGVAAEAGGADLLPDGIDAGEGVPVTSGRTEALRYRQAPVGGVRGTLVAIPSVEGVIAIACLPGPRSRAGFGSDCEEAAATISLDGPRPLPVGPDPAYARGLHQVITALNERLRLRSQRLREEAVLDEQVLGAREVASAWTAAHAAARRVSPGPANAAVHDRLVRALEVASGAAEDLVRAVRREDDEAVVAAEGDVDAARRRADRALDDLASLGYPVAG